MEEINFGINVVSKTQNYQWHVNASVIMSILFCFTLLRI